MNKKKTPDISQRIIDLTQKAEISQKSVNWWEQETERVLNEIDKAENDASPESEDKIFKLIKELSVIVSRARLEIEIIDKMEEELHDILNEKKVINKKSPRKKTI